MSLGCSFTSRVRFDTSRSRGTLRTSEVIDSARTAADSRTARARVARRMRTLSGLRAATSIAFLSLFGPIGLPESATRGQLLSILAAFGWAYPLLTVASVDDGIVVVPLDLERHML